MSAAMHPLGPEDRYWLPRVSSVNSSSMSTAPNLTTKFVLGLNERLKAAEALHWLARQTLRCGFHWRLDLVTKVLSKSEWLLLSE